MNDNSNNKKILIVEDTEAIAYSLNGLLEKYGAIDIARNGEEALMKVFLDSFDIIISDIKMPFMNGIEFYKAAVENDPSIKKRFLFHTASFEKDHLSFILNNNVPVLFKPADTKELVRAVTEILYRQYSK
jgi:two-component system response regulator YesN